MKQQNFSISKRIKSFKYALKGLRILLTEEHNARVHLLASICVVSAGFIFSVSTYEWIAIILCISLVVSLEIVNSSIENIADFIHPERHEKIKKIKDLSASAVLIGAITAFVIGMIIFIPKIINLC